MSQEFLKEGDAVVICGRDLERVSAAVKALQVEAPRSQVWDTCKFYVQLTILPPIISFVIPLSHGATLTKINL